MLKQTRQMPPQEAPQVEGPLNRLRVCFQAVDDAGCGGYRCILPVEQMRRLGAKAKWTFKITYQDYNNYDVFVWQRPYEPNLAQEIREVSRAGKLTIIEADDNLHKVPFTSPVFEQYKSGKHGHFNKSLEAADGLILTTPQLAEHYYKFNRNIVVAPNCIDLTLGLRDWSGINDEIQKKPGEVVMAFRGGSSHQADLMTLNTVIKPLMVKYPHLRLSMYTNTMLSEAMIKIWGIEEYRERVTIIEPRHFMDYPEALGGADFYFVPLVKDIFNDGKSELGMCEVGALGIPCVASAAAPYLRFAENEKFGLTAGSSKEFFEKCCLMIENESLRLSLGEAAKQKVYTRYNLGTGVKNWIDAFSALWDQKNKGDVGPPTINNTSNSKKGKRK